MRLFVSYYCPPTFYRYSRVYTKTEGLFASLTVTVTREYVLLLWTNSSTLSPMCDNHHHQSMVPYHHTMVVKKLIVELPTLFSHHAPSATAFSQKVIAVSVTPNILSSLPSCMVLVLYGGMVPPYQLDIPLSTNPFCSS
jgi:hypothetical protein